MTTPAEAPGSEAPRHRRTTHTRPLYGSKASAPISEKNAAATCAAGAVQVPMPPHDRAAAGVRFTKTVAPG